MIVQMNDPYSISNFFIPLFKTYFIASKLQLYILDSITLLNCQCNVFLTMCSYYNSYFFKKDCSYRNNCGIQLHDGDLEHSIMKEKKKIDVITFFFPFLCSGISDLALGILKMLIRVYFRDVLQPAVY